MRIRFEAEIPLADVINARPMVDLMEEELFVSDIDVNIPANTIIDIVYTLNIDRTFSFADAQIAIECVFEPLKVKNFRLVE